MRARITCSVLGYERLKALGSETLAEKGHTEREDPSPCLSPVRGKERRETGEREADSLACGSLASSSP